MLNFSELIVDPDFSQSITVTRQLGDWSASTGKFENTTRTITMPAIVKPLTTKQLAAMPEADRASGMINVYTLAAVFPTSLEPTKRVSDLVTWHGEQYRVTSISDYADYGFYKAVCARIVGA
jgi:hypothetical protein